MNALSVHTGMIHECLLFVPLSSFVRSVGWLVGWLLLAIFTVLVFLPHSMLVTERYFDVNFIRDKSRIQQYSLQ